MCLYSICCISTVILARVTILQSMRAYLLVWVEKSNVELSLNFHLRLLKIVSYIYRSNCSRQAHDDSSSSTIVYGHMNILPYVLSTVLTVFGVYFRSLVTMSTEDAELMHIKQMKREFEAQRGRNQQIMESSQRRPIPPPSYSEQLLTVPTSPNMQTSARLGGKNC